MSAPSAPASTLTSSSGYGARAMLCATMWKGCGQILTRLCKDKDKLRWYVCLVVSSQGVGATTTGQPRSEDARSLLKKTRGRHAVGTVRCRCNTVVRLEGEYFRKKVL